MILSRLLAAALLPVAVHSSAVYARHATPGTARTAVPAVAGDAKLRLELNVPAYRLDVFLRDRLLWSYTVAVGMPGYPTPIRDYRITEVVWNPWWIPPPSDWARKERPQPPGPTNPMGRVKLQAGAYYYLHGTPDEASLGRASSHGCIRMANGDALQLASLVLLYAPPGGAQTDLHGPEANPDRTLTIALDRPVPLRSVYRIAEVRGRALEIYPDVYGRVDSPAGEVRRLLDGLGIDAARIDRARLDSVVRMSRRERVVIPLDSLLVAPRAR